MLLTTRPILRRFGMYLCRDCINREYGVHLKREDVRYKYTEDPCPYCGATTTPDASGCCEYCGGAVNG